MKSSFVILACCIGAVLAYPYQYEAAEGYDVEVANEQQLNFLPYPTVDALHRVRRQVQVQGGGGGSPGKGFDLSLDTRVPVWTSPNGRHSFDATGGYSQHLGGPYGNSKPDYRAGGVYTFRF